MSETQQSPGSERPQGNGLAVASLVLGIVGLVGLCLWFVGLPCAILALIFGIIGRKRAKETGTGGGMATAGLVLGIVALGLVVVGVILAIVGFSFWGKQIQQEIERQRHLQRGSLGLALPLLLLLRRRLG